MQIRVPFFDIFQELPDGSLTPKRRLEVNGTQFGPGMTFRKGVAFGGIDFQLFKGKALAIDEQPDGTARFIGFYNE